MKIYLDASTLNRPFDDQRVVRNRLEAEATLAILTAVETGEYQLLSSAALVYENTRNPFPQRRKYVTAYLNLATSFVPMTPPLRQRAMVFEQRGIHALDALHLASAEAGAADAFITCDNRIIQYGKRGELDTSVTISTPIEFVVYLGEEHDKSSA